MDPNHKRKSISSETANILKDDFITLVVNIKNAQNIVG